MAISLDRAINYAKTQGFRIREYNHDGLVDITLIDTKRREYEWIANHPIGEGVDKSVEDKVREYLNVAKQEPDPA